MCEPAYDDEGNIIGIRCPNALGEPGVPGPTGPPEMPFEYVSPWFTVDQFEGGWGNVKSDPLKDLQEWAERMFNEHWVCRGCGRVTNYRPERCVTQDELLANPRALLMQPLRCACGSTDWRYSTEPRPAPSKPDPCLVSLDVDFVLPFGRKRRIEKAWQEARKCPHGCGETCQGL